MIKDNRGRAKSLRGIETFDLINQDFFDNAEAIRHICDEKKKISGLRPFEDKFGFFKRNSYALIRDTISKRGAKQIFSSILRKCDIIYGLPEYTDNQFYWGILAIDPYLEIIKSRTNLWRFSKEMLLAHRNNVPPKYLVGFLHQTASQRDLDSRIATRQPDPSLILETVARK